MFERILVIESDSQVQKYMGSFLEKHKYQCVLTDKGKVGWSVLRNSSMDLIILDMMLEDYGALEFIRDVRSVSQLSLIHILEGGCGQPQAGGTSECTGIRGNREPGRGICGNGKDAHVYCN